MVAAARRGEGHGSGRRRGAEKAMARGGGGGTRLGSPPLPGPVGGRPGEDGDGGPTAAVLPLTSPSSSSPSQNPNPRSAGGG